MQHTPATTTVIFEEAGKKEDFGDLFHFVGEV